MNVSTISMDKNQAKQAFLQYRDLVRLRHNAEDEAIMRGYKHLSKGKALIDVSAAIAHAGTDHKYLPRLAISRADYKIVWYRGWRNGSGRFTPSQWPNASTVRSGVFEMKEGTFPIFSGSAFDAKAIVPIIPAHLRPAGSLKRFHILWEADWEAVPRDPMLLRHMGGCLFVVLAVWDLTEIERAVLAGRK